MDLPWLTYKKPQLKISNCDISAKDNTRETDINLYLTPLGQIRQFIETRGT